MRLLIVGATGHTGLQVIEQGLTRGHLMTAVVRKNTLKEAEGLRIVIADPCKTNNLLPLLEEQDAVISCLGQRLKASTGRQTCCWWSFRYALRLSNHRRQSIRPILHPILHPVD